MSGKIVTVVGGSGFVGRYVVQHLAQAGYRVRVLCRRPSTADFVKTSGVVGQVGCDYVDLTRPESLAGKLNGSFAVVNLAGILHQSGRQRFDKVQAKGAELLAMEAKRAGVMQFVQLSALAVDKASHSRYAQSKLDGEAAIRALFPQAVILRPSVIFGAEDHFINLFARLSVLAPALPLIGGGKTRFQPVYVDDVAKTVVAALTKPQLQGKIIELGGPDVLSFRDILQFIGKQTGRERRLLPLPAALASLMAIPAEFLPNPPITRDQIRLLKTDNVVSGQFATVADTGVEPQSLAAVMPHYLNRFRK